MKKLIIVLLLISVLLSGCFYSRSDIDEMQEQWNEKYYDLEEQINLETERADGYQSVIGDLYDHYLTINACFDELPDDEAEENIQSALFSMHDIFNDLGY